MQMSMESVCRTCLSSDALQPLFPLKSTYHTFQRELFLCTGLQIKTDDGLPQMICKACAIFIKSAIRFRNKSHASEVKLKQGLKCQENYYKEENVNSSSFPTETCVKEEYSTSLGEEDSTCVKEEDFICVKEEDSICVKEEVIGPQTEQTNFIFESCAYDEYVDPVSSTNDDRVIKKEPVEIEICIQSKENKSEDIKKKNIIEIEAKKNSVGNAYMDLVEISNDPENPSQCKLKRCNKTMKTKKRIRHSLGYRFLCELCGSSHSSTLQFARHQQARHLFARDDRLSCSYCDYRAIEPEMLKVHERSTHTKERPFVCDNCGKAFYSKRVLKQHLVLHTTDKPFQCDICQRTFKSKPRLTVHTIRTHRERKNKYKYSCPNCPKTYINSHGCRKHIMKAHGIPRDQQGKLAHFIIH